jgi:RNase P protein component
VRGSLLLCRAVGDAVDRNDTAYRFRDLIRNSSEMTHDVFDVVFGCAIGADGCRRTISIHGFK